MLRSLFSTARRVLHPILADEPVIDIEGSAAAVFYTTAAQWLERHIELVVAGVSGVFLLIAWVLGLAGGPEPLRNLCILLSFTIAGIPALSEVWGKLSAFRIDIDLLMLLGAMLAVWIGSPFEGALLLFLFALSGALEKFAVRRTQSAIVALHELAPTEANLIDGDTVQRVPLRNVQIGAHVLVRPGEKIPVDGVVESGSSSVDESAITGESIPRDCGVSETVFAGTHNINGRLEIRVTRRSSDTTLAKIVELVTKARHRPATAQRLIDRIGPTYSAVVILSSLAVGLVGGLVFHLDYSEATRRAIAVLIVASPCALIIATPVAYLSAIAAAARRGVLIKGGVFLEVIAKAGAVAFDKTGTLTTGRILLTDIVPADGITESESLRIAGAMERSSTHPLAAAVNRALEHRGLSPYSVTKFESIAGEGDTGVVNNQSVWIGRPELAARRIGNGASASVLERTAQLRQFGKTVSAVIVDDRVGLMAFQDTSRPGAAACVDRLRRQGIKRIDMLTGDHEIVAKQVATDLKLDGYLAELAPADKVKAAERLRAENGAVILVGDGINDAPALAHADAGIAMGSLGADVALEAAHVVIMKDRIERVAWLHGHARRTARIVRQNLTLAITVIATLSVFAALGSVPLPLAVVGHEGSTVVVALNALRLLRSTEDE